MGKKVDFSTASLAPKIRGSHNVSESGGKGNRMKKIADYIFILVIICVHAHLYFFKIPHEEKVLSGFSEVLPALTLLLFKYSYLIIAFMFIEIITYSIPALCNIGKKGKVYCEVLCLSIFGVVVGGVYIVTYLPMPH